MATQQIVITDRKVTTTTGKDLIVAIEGYIQYILNLPRVPFTATKCNDEVAVAHGGASEEKLSPEQVQFIIGEIKAMENYDKYNQSL